MATLQEALTPEVLEFARRAGLLEHLHTAIELAHASFPEAQSMRAEVVWDPESEHDEWISLTLCVPGEVDDIIARDRRFMEHWVTVMPWPAADKIVFQLDIR